MKERKKKISVAVVMLFLLVGGILFLTYCKETNWSSDAKQIHEFFPIFADSTVVSWKAKSDDTWGIGPSNTSIKGYIQLDNNQLNMLLHDYSWYETDGVEPYKIEPSPNFPYIDLDWLVSNDLASQIMPPRFVGWIFLDEDNEIIYFYAEFA